MSAGGVKTGHACDGNRRSGSCGERSTEPPDTEMNRVEREALEEEGEDGIWSDSRSAKTNRGVWLGDEIGHTVRGGLGGRREAGNANSVRSRNTTIRDLLSDGRVTGVALSFLLKRPEWAKSRKGSYNGDRYNRSSYVSGPPPVSLLSVTFL